MMALKFTQNQMKLTIEYIIQEAETWAENEALQNYYVFKIYR